MNWYSLSLTLNYDEQKCIKMLFHNVHLVRRTVLIDKILDKFHLPDFFNTDHSSHWLLFPRCFFGTSRMFNGTLTDVKDQHLLIYLSSANIEQLFLEGKKPGTNKRAQSI